MSGHSNRCNNEGEWHSKSNYNSRQKDEYEEISNEEKKIHRVSACCCCLLADY